MSFDVKIVADSVGPDGQRLTTMQLRYPRFIHSEMMTHRVFSRNASSSRAIPVAKMIEQVRNDPAMPIHWGKNQPGMQAHEELGGDDRETVEFRWRQAARDAAFHAEWMAGMGAHKQIVNRILEPFQWMHTIVTATEWDNFFALRCHKDAQPEIRHLAELMRDALHRSAPQALDFGQWHLPYVDAQIEDDGVQSYRHWITDPPVPGEFKAVGMQFIDLMQAIRCSTARCARVSYLTHEGKRPSLEDDSNLFLRLMGSNPMHSSPAEHQATPIPILYADGKYAEWSYENLMGNFVGFAQHRRLLDGGHNPVNLTIELQRKKETA